MLEKHHRSPEDTGLTGLTEPEPLGTRLEEHDKIL